MKHFLLKQKYQIYFIGFIIVYFIGRIIVQQFINT